MLASNCWNNIYFRKLLKFVPPPLRNVALSRCKIMARCNYWNYTKCQQVPGVCYQLDYLICMCPQKYEYVLMTILLYFRKIKLWQWCDVITPWQQSTWSCSPESWPCEFVSLVLLHSPWSGSAAWGWMFLNSGATETQELNQIQIVGKQDYLFERREYFRRTGKEY